jgi:hypothetical protein
MDEQKRNIIVDLDGTIALDDHRAHHLRNDPNNRDWDSYFAACGGDAPNHAVIQTIRAMAYGGWTITIISGRSMKVEEQTVAWLKKHEVPVDMLMLRPADSRVDDHLMKIQMAATLNLTPKNVLFVLEDRQRVVDAWRAAGFTCFQVAPGQF